MKPSIHVRCFYFVYSIQLLSYYFTGFSVTEEQLKDVAEMSGVLEVPQDFLSTEMREQCSAIIPYPTEVEPNECYDAFKYLKHNLLQQLNLADDQSQQ